jgi:prepilin-type N-terminal cleavage/methylation domain-containing protein
VPAPLIENLPMTYFKPPSQHGFTLLELVLVLFLIGLLASAGLLFTESQQDAAYFEETQRRQTMIRDAIIRSTERVVNGQPELAGFAVDNGRLPYCLRELVVSPFELTDSASATGYYESPCDPSKKLLKPMVTDRGIRVGWYGPYIQVNPEQDGERRFRDGYQNGLDPDDPNFGWIVALEDAIGTEPERTLRLASEGYDLSTDADDYPPAGSDALIVDNDWLAASSFSLRFVNTSSASAVQNLDSNLDWTVTLAKSSTDPNAYSHNFSFTPPGSSISPQGEFEYTVAVSSATLFADKIPAGYYVFEASCSATPQDRCPDMVSSPYTIMVLPRQQLGPFRWNIKP